MKVRVVPLDAVPVRVRMRLRWPHTHNPVTDHRVAGDAYVIVALEGRRIVGYWSINAPVVRGARVRVESSVTYVIERLRRGGLAWRLWRCGVGYWRPTAVEACAATYEGARFLFRVGVRLAQLGVRPVFDFGSFGYFGTINEIDFRRRVNAARCAHPKKKKAA